MRVVSHVIIEKAISYNCNLFSYLTVTVETQSLFTSSKVNI